MALNYTTYYNYDFDKNIIEEEINNFPFVLNNEQIEAIKSISENDFNILTGGPGTGKSTILKALVNIYDRHSWNTVLLSPTGKATRRIEECTGKRAYTIHRYLGIKNSIDDIESKTVDRKTIIFIDESSMCDIMIFEKLLQCFNVDTRIVLIGDVDQLPSVGCGRVLEDLIDCGKLNICKLTNIMRQTENSNIILNCSIVNKGFDIEQCNLHDFYYKSFYNSETLLNNFLKLYENEMKNIEDINDIQVITCYKKHALGTHKVNELISSIYNKNEKDEKFGFKLNDKVMQIKNNYQKDVFNGEIGVVKEITDDYMIVSYCGGDICYEVDEVDELIQAWVSTTHKAQGSEYKVVFVILDDVSSILLTRKLLYTAMSRGKGKTYILSMREALETCVRNTTESKRITKLSEFIQYYDNICEHCGEPEDSCDCNSNYYCGPADPRY